MMLLEYFKEYNLGDMLPESNHIFEEVMMANLMLLYPEWNPHLAKRQEWMNISPQGLIEGAERYKSILGGVPPLEQLLSELDINKEFKDILKRLLDLDPRRRSSALAILESPEYEALNRAVYG
jgi:serine/threonine protein kinase